MQVAHEAFDRATSDWVALPLHLGPDLVGPIHVEVLGIDPTDLGLKRLVAALRGTRWARLELFDVNVKIYYR
jgi:kynureninase